MYRGMDVWMHGNDINSGRLEDWKQRNYEIPHQVRDDMLLYWSLKERIV